MSIIDCTVIKYMLFSTYLDLLSLNLVYFVLEIFWKIIFPWLWEPCVCHVTNYPSSIVGKQWKDPVFTWLCNHLTTIKYKMARVMKWCECRFKMLILLDLFSLSSEDRIRNGAKKLSKSRGTSTQGRLDNFFKVTSVTSTKRKVY